MSLLDSSTLIEYYRPRGRDDVQSAVAEAIEADRGAINGVVQTEILAFVRGKGAFRELAEDFRALHWIDLDRAVFDRAAALGADLRRHGVTVLATDLIIAASAVQNGATLLHLDAHFDSIARHADLTVRSFVR